VSAAGSLRTARDFRRVYSEGVRARSDGLTLHLAPRAESGRLGLAIPKSVGSAVVRNRLRRRLRAAARACELTSQADVVLGADQRAGGLSYQELESHVKGALGTAERRLRR
jgi:ribonuclease P protein component